MQRETMMQHHNVVSLMRREQFAQRTEAWYEVRKHMLTASDVASVQRLAARGFIG